MAGWNDRWRTGNNVFDLDHKQLSTLLDLLEDSLGMLPDSTFPDMLAHRLVREAREHFRREENYLRLHPTPQTAGHVAMHEAFADKLDRLVARIEANDGAGARDLIVEAQRMFVDELLPADSEMMATLAARIAVAH
ncbi:MAG TPA: hemerythrin domain-containing protein [Azospirillum sp.]|nr:hemerythrin domain-containing protein [Azospirillum sp.]